MTQHKNVHAALAAAQAEMGPLLKGSINPHFKSKYAELADVVEAVRIPFGNHGISYFHTIEVLEPLGTCLTTILCHGESDTSIRCPVPLIVAKQDMQGFKSATTYAKRIGLESVSGLAPEDDDGNAAAKAAPKPPSSAQMKRELETLKTELSECETEVSLIALWKAWAAKMRNENWPDEDGETSFPAMAKRMFGDRKKALEDMTPMDDEPEPEQARYLRAG